MKTKPWGELLLYYSLYTLLKKNVYSVMNMTIQIEKKNTIFFQFCNKENKIPKNIPINNSGN